MQDQTRNMLRRRPGYLNQTTPDGPNWDEKLRFVAEFREDMGPVFNKYYHSIPDKFRPGAASIIAQSEHRHCIRTPDATYLYAWLESSFERLRKQLVVGQKPNNSPLFGGRNTTVLSTWLRADPVLLGSLPFLVSAAFNRSGAQCHVSHEMATMIDYTVPRHFRVRRFYPEFVTQVPTALRVAAQHMDEKNCLLNMCSRQCRYAAGLHSKWRSVYPDSLIADDVNQILNTMQALDVYEPSLLHTGLGLKEGPAFEEILLPAGLDQWSAA